PGEARRNVDHKELVGGPDLADEGEHPAIRRPFRRVVATRAGARRERLRIEQSPDHDAALVLPRSPVRPADLICDSLAVSSEANMVYPAEQIEIFGDYRSGHYGLA